MSNFFLSPENGRYYLGVQFTYQDRIYPGNLASFTELGFTEVIVQPMPDPTYYTVGNVNDDGTWNYTAKPIADIKSHLVNNANSTAKGILDQSDWYVTRKSESGVEIPAEWSDYRAEVRTVTNTYRDSVNAATTVEQLEAIGSNPKFPYAPGSVPVVA